MVQACPCKCQCRISERSRKQADILPYTVTGVSQSPRFFTAFVKFTMKCRFQEIKCTTVQHRGNMHSRVPVCQTYEPRLWNTWSFKPWRTCPEDEENPSFPAYTSFCPETFPTKNQTQTLRVCVTYLPTLLESGWFWGQWISISYVHAWNVWVIMSNVLTRPGKASRTFVTFCCDNLMGPSLPGFFAAGNIWHSTSDRNIART